MGASVPWEQYVYGKLVVAPGGPIVSGSEHGCTARSPGFPASLTSWCHPKKIGFGVESGTAWARYPWRGAGGGILCRPVEALFIRTDFPRGDCEGKSRNRPCPRQKTL